MNVVYQGTKGSYSEAAANEFFKSNQFFNENIKFNGVISFKKCYEEVESGNANFAVVPIENSIGGSIHTNFDLLSRYKLYIIAELNFRIKHCLIALPGTKKTDIQYVYSHPQALMQCEKYLSEYNFEAIPYIDTASSVNLIKEKNIAIIASEQTAKYNKLEIIDSNIEDNENNFTRFVLISKEMNENGEKISIVFTLINSIGSLSKTLSIFSDYGIDLIKIESRPNTLHKIESNKNEKFDVMFFIDSKYTTNFNNVLNKLKEISPYIKILGIYSNIQNNHNINKINRNKLNIGIIGFGKFGQFLAKRFINQGNNVIVTSRQNYSLIAKEIGVQYHNNINNLLEEHIDILILSMSICSFEEILNKIPLNKLKGKLIVDVLSVKEYPKNILLKLMPEDTDILCTHPMFGPESGKYSWKDLNFCYEKVRILNNERCNHFLNIFKKEQCNLIEMSCEEHDKYAAKSQFITHFITRMLSLLNLKSTKIDTIGFKTLLELINITISNSDDLFNALFKYNSKTIIEIENIKNAMNNLIENLKINELKN